MSFFGPSPAGLPVPRFEPYVQRFHLAVVAHLLPKRFWHGSVQSFFFGQKASYSPFLPRRSYPLLKLKQEKFKRQTMAKRLQQILVYCSSLFRKVILSIC
jgi:hypothetical protein